MKAVLTLGLSCSRSVPRNRERGMGSRSGNGGRGMDSRSGNGERQMGSPFLGTWNVSRVSVVENLETYLDSSVS